MTKMQEAWEPGSCWNKAADDEQVFVLRGKDKAAFKAILYWVEWRLRYGLNEPDDEQVTEAFEQGRRMYEYAFKEDLDGREREQLKAVQRKLLETERMTVVGRGREEDYKTLEVIEKWMKDRIDRGLNAQDPMDEEISLMLRLKDRIILKVVP